MTTSRPLLHEISFFAVAVCIGSLAGLVVSVVLERWFAASTSANAALAVATTCAAATHARIVHAQNLKVLLPKVVVGAPVAYAVMRLVHVVVGS